ncbi:MAG: hypothetical protein ABI680_04180 [Chthoniobacteraceae bacterium]
MNAHSIIATIAALVAAPFSGLAGDAPAQKTEPAKPEPKVARYQAKTKSVFDLDEQIRPPFWPIGWIKREGGVVIVKRGPRFNLDEKEYRVTSILTGPPALAVINGHAYEEGQFLRIPRTTVQALGNVVPHIRVHRIVDGQVWLVYENETISIRLKRGQLKDEPPPEELLNGDKDFVVPTLPATPVSPSVSRR